jgi:hypothetical protein
MKTWFACFALAAMAAAEALAGSTNAPRPDLTGRILTQDGSPVPEAAIFVYSAGPKVGRGTL